MLFLPEHRPDADPAHLISAFRQHGVLLFRQSGTHLSDFRRWSDRLSQGFQAYVGGASNGRQTLDEDGHIMTVTGSEHGYAIPLHGEMYYQATSPEALWFFARRDSAVGGETWLADGREIYRRLSPVVRQRFENHAIVYSRRHVRSVWPALYGTSDRKRLLEICRARGLEAELDPDSDELRTRFRCSALVRNAGNTAFVNNILPFALRERTAPGGSPKAMVRFENDDAAMSEDLLNELCAVAETCTHRHAWKAGDILLLDNRRMMHGRGTLDDSPRDILVRLCDRLRD